MLAIKTNGLAVKAMLLAREVHRNQVRKYTGNPYTDHLAEVAGIAVTGYVAEEIAYAVIDNPVDVIAAAAWLHDSIEDQNVEPGYLEEQFGFAVANAVVWLSDTEKGSRATRKAASRARLAQAPSWVQTIKCADLISNTSSILKHDPKFAIIYLEEKRLLLDVLTKAHSGLRALAYEQCRGN